MARVSSACSRSTRRWSNSIKLVRRGKVRRAKLYYLRGLRGKSARIAEGAHHGGQSADVAETPKK